MPGSVGAARAGIGEALALRGGLGQSRCRAARAVHHARQFIEHLVPWPEGMFNEAQLLWLFSARWMHVSRVLGERPGALGRRQPRVNTDTLSSRADQRN